MYKCKLVELLRSFARSEKGATATVMALLLVPTVGVAGVSVDLGQAYRTQTRLQAAVDTAAMLAARDYQLNSNQTQAEGIARSAFAAAQPDVGTASAVIDNVTIDPSTNTVKIVAHTQVKTIFMGVITGQSSQISINASSEATANAIAMNRNVEVSLMLDITSSMSQGSGTRGVTKLAAMQNSAKSLIATVVQADQSKYTSRVALVPFSAAVNVGSYYRSVVGSSPYGSWTSVVERGGASAFTDDPPRAGSYVPSYRSMHGSALGPYGSLERNRTSNIPTASYIVPLTSNTTSLNNAIDALSANGTTAGHIGIAWSWYMLSPNWSSIWTGASTPNPVDKDTLKVAVLMSDFDFNVYYQSGNGDMNAQAAALCTAMKSAGIVVYTVGFQVDSGNTTAYDLFRNCASDSSKAISAQTGADLTAAYNAIAKNVVASAGSPVRFAR